jgi:hypothetical protein
VDCDVAAVCLGLSVGVHTEEHTIIARDGNSELKLARRHEPRVSPDDFAVFRGTALAHVGFGATKDDDANTASARHGQANVMHIHGDALWRIRLQTLALHIVVFVFSNPLRPSRNGDGVSFSVSLLTLVMN